MSTRISLKKLLASVSLLLLVCNIAKAQTKFSFTPPVGKVPGIYRKITLLDSRMDTITMGFVQKGLINIPRVVIPDTTLKIQFANVLAALTDTVGAKHELLLQLREMAFAEVTKTTRENGYFYFKANLYDKQGDSYQLISAIDTVAKIISHLDVTGALLKSGNKIVTDFIKQNLDKGSQTNRVYSYNDILNIDQVETTKLKAYNTDTFTDGLYLSYNSFCAQTPDAKVSVPNKGTINDVFTFDKNDKPTQLMPGSAYAVVLNGTPYIATDYGYYPLKKFKDHFFFTGQASLNDEAYHVIVQRAYMYKGNLVTTGNDYNYLTRIEYHTGDFLRVRKEARMPKKQSDDAY